MPPPTRRNRRRGQDWNATGAVIVGPVVVIVGLALFLGSVYGGDTFRRRFMLLTIVGGLSLAFAANLAINLRHFGYIDVIRVGRIYRHRSPRRYWGAVVLMHSPVLALLGFAIWVAVTGGPR